jgi:hypothetical protein
VHFFASLYRYLFGGLFGASKPEGALTWKLFEHPLICSLSDNYNPSYIPAQNFVAALLDVVLPDPAPALGSPTPGLGNASPALGNASPGVAGQRTVTDPGLRDAIDKITNKNVRGALLALYDEARGDLAKFRASVEAWFNSVMERVSGAYKRWTQVIIFLLGAAVTVGLNVDTIAIVTLLSQDKGARGRAVAAAEEYVRQHKDQPAAGKSDGAPGPQTGDEAKIEDKLRKQIEADLGQLGSVGLPLGWSEATLSRGDKEPLVLWWLSKAVGWLLTAFAISLGAPFWFDLLNKFMVVRSTVKPFEKSPPEGSKDKEA